jgi:glycosyltransferase involved in cell wall biosynthesis
MQPPAHRPEPNKTRFLFVGGTNQRKGSDLLLKAFHVAFDAKDSVELVIKAHTSIFYPASQPPKKRRGGAPVRFIDKHYSESDLAKLYQSASALVLPYRAEGFALPLLEAMACGTPVVAPRFGPALDFCSTKNSFLTRCTRVDLPVKNQLTYNALGHSEYIDRATICEVSVESLAEELRKIHSLRGSALFKKGRCAARDVAKSKTWTHSAKVILRRLQGLI